MSTNDEVATAATHLTILDTEDLIDVVADEVHARLENSDRVSSNGEARQHYVRLRSMLKRILT